MLNAKVINLEYKPRSKEPFTIFFVYTPNGNYVLKGGEEICKCYVKNNFAKCFYRYSFWMNGKSRGGWQSNCGIYFTPVPKSNKTQIHKYDKNGKFKLLITVRRIPHKWLEIFNND